MNIPALCTALKLTYVRDNYEQFVTEARQTSKDPEAFLAELLENEFRRRMENGQNRRIRFARFPIKKYLCDFDRTKYDQVFQPKFKELESLAFIDKKENIILIGTPGAGKTHYAIALGIEACMAGKSVLFASAPNLIIEMKEAMSQNQITVFRRKFETFSLVILDELGYVSFEKQACELLFNLLSSRNGKGSIIVTTNLTFDRWQEVFHDPTLTGAMVDRLAHKAHILDISREKGGRYEETLEWLRVNNGTA